MQLKLTKRTVDGILAISCSGRIVFGEESSLLRDEVKKAIADGNKRIVLNLGEVNYIDSGGNHQTCQLDQARWGPVAGNQAADCV
jgi:anti-sigma B factor antagonist